MRCTGVLQDFSLVFAGCFWVHSKTSRNFLHILSMCPAGLYNSYRIPAGILQKKRKSCRILVGYSGLQSAIQMIRVIILAAVRKGYKLYATCRILTCDTSLVAGTTSLCLQTWRNDAVPWWNLPWNPTRITQIRKHYYKLTVVNRAKVRQ